jgi:hypothetical protein
MKNKEKPIYEEPKVFKLDEQEAVYGGGADDCNGNGSSADVTPAPLMVTMLVIFVKLMVTALSEDNTTCKVLQAKI